MSAKDLIQFLDPVNEAVAKIALENVLPYTAASANQTFLFTANDFNGIKNLKKLSTQSNDPSVVQNALIALINLTDVENVREELASDRNAIQQYGKYIVSVPKLPFVQYSCMLLSNLGRACDTMAALKGPMLAAIVLTLAKPANVSDEEYDFAAVAISELASQDAVAVARSLPYMYTELIIKRDAPSASVNRRKGVAAAIKNTLFDEKLHEPLADDTPLVETLMLTVKGPEEMDPEDFDKLPALVKNNCGSTVREPDVVVQYLHLESLLLLSSSQAGRNALRAKNVYYVVRELHKSTNSPQIAEICEKFVNMVMRGEPSEQKQQSVAAIAAIKGEEDEDDKIVEVV